MDEDEFFDDDAELFGLDDLINVDAIKQLNHGNDKKWAEDFEEKTKNMSTEQVAHINRQVDKINFKLRSRDYRKIYNEDMTVEECTELFVTQITSPTTHINAMRDFTQLPIAKSLGLFDFKIERVYTGFRKDTPIYLLKLPNPSKTIVRAEKVGNTTTPHWKIIIEKAGISSKDKGREILGRVRGNVKSTQFYLFDTGLHPQEFSKHKKTEVRARRQFSTVMWTGIEHPTTKKPSNLELYLPEVTGNMDISSWPDNMKKKSSIATELANQKAGNDKQPPSNEKVKQIVYFKNQGMFTDPYKFSIGSEGTSKTFMKFE